MLNFKSMIRKEYSVYSYAEAVAAVEADGFKVMRNKTNSWKAAGSPVSDKDFKVFATAQMEKEKLVDVPGVGFMVVVAPGSKDTRERPYTLENVINEGRLNTVRTYEWHRDDTDEVVLTLSGKDATKDAAIKAAKERMSELKTNLTLKIVYRVKDGKDVAARLKYTPSVNAEVGKYIFVGNEVSAF